MACMNPVQIHYNMVTHKYQFLYDKDCDPTRTIHVSCGRCPSCAKKWRTQLSQRALMEFHKYGYERTCFLTLTVDPEHEHLFGKNWELDHSVIQKFMKRLRARLKYYKIDVKIKYLCCGEYGENGTHRPHWHMILYGWKPTDLRYFGKSKGGYNTYKSEFIESCWQNGIVDVGDVTENSAPYLAKYIAKYKEVRKDEFYNEEGVIIKKPYIVYPKEMLGADFFVDNYIAILRNGCLFSSNGSKVSIPKCFLKLAERYDFMAKELEEYKKRLKEYFQEYNEELRELGYVTPEERYAYALEQGQKYRENYNSYMANVKGVVING